MKTALVMDRDPAFLSQLMRWLGELGWSVVDASDGAPDQELTLRHETALVVCEVSALGDPGLQFLLNLLMGKDFKHNSPLIIALGGNQPADKANALEAGADEYMVKPVSFEALGKVLTRHGAPSSPTPPDKSAATGNNQGGENVRLKFWGVRGSIPSPGPETVFYGGNTSCVEVRVGSDIIILDAGSGLRRLGLALEEEFKKKPIQLNLLITHTHWDHIQGFPFFLPAYDPKNNVTIYGFEGATQGLQSTLSDQMESPYFPISMKQMPGHIAIRELRDLNFNVNQVPVKARFLNHPGICTGYRLFTPGGSISYLPDIELYQRLRQRWESETRLVPQEEREIAPAEDRELIEFIRDSDVLILDAQYDAKEYEQHIGWGHSCVEDSVAFALHANVKRLFLFHHDPDHTDEHISRMVARARQMAARRRSDLIVEAAREGYELVLAPKTAAKS